jgi:uncharacterized membrane protein YbaN (DUF454 family)
MGSDAETMTRELRRNRPARLRPRHAGAFAGKMRPLWAAFLAFYRRIRRGLFLGLGVLFVILGVIGLFVPVMPTTVFMILAAACFAKSNRRLEQWLVNHRHFGPHIRDWRAHKSIRLSVKVVAIVLMGGSLLFSFFVLQLPFWALVAAGAMGVAMVGVLLWIPTRRG